jgi:hypothetical protein
VRSSKNLGAQHKNMKNLRTFLLTCIFTILALNSYAEERPLWIDNPGMTFSKNDIYAVGNGKDLSEAKSNARAEIMKYFETNISSKFQGNMSATEESTDKTSQEQLSETTGGIIKGINITNTYKDKDGFYALAVLDKKKTIAELEYEIENLDSKMQVLQENGDMSGQIGKVYADRERLNKKYMFLTGNSIISKIKYEDVFKSTLQTHEDSAKRNRGNIGKIQVKVIPESLGFKTQLTNYLRELGYNINPMGKTVFVKAEEIDCTQEKKTWVCNLTLEITFKSKTMSYQAKGLGKDKEQSLKNAGKDAVNNFPSDFYI